MKHAKIIRHLKFVFCTFTISFSELIIGGSYVFSSTVFAQLQDPSSTINLNTEEKSWITSIPILVCPIGLIIMGILADVIGRMKTVQLSCIPLTLSWLIIAFANSYETILIGRILLGIPFGICACMFLYIAEVCPANQRTLYFSVCPNNIGIGMLFVNILSMYFHWRTISAIFCAMSFANVIILFWVPESPMWLRANGRNEQADKVVKWFDVTYDNSAVTMSPMNYSVDSSDEIGSKPYWSLYLRPAVWKPTLIIVFLFAIQQGTGVNVLLFYSMDVIHDCRIPWDANTVSVFLSGSRVVGAIVFASLHRVKRRTLLIISGGCMAASLLVVLAYMRTFRNVEHPPYAITPIIAFVVFLFFCMIGILPVPWAICGEVFPTAVSGVMNGVVQTIGFFLWFVVCKTYPSLIIKLGVECVWSIFGVFCLASTLFTIYILPETKGKSLDEILSYFESNEKIKKINIENT